MDLPLSADFPETHLYRHPDFDLGRFALGDFTHHPAAVYKVHNADNRR